jgi:hypothetical protein
MADRIEVSRSTNALSRSLESETSARMSELALALRDGTFNSPGRAAASAGRMLQ